MAQGLGDEEGMDTTVYRLSRLGARAGHTGGGLPTCIFPLRPLWISECRSCQANDTLWGMWQGVAHPLSGAVDARWSRDYYTPCFHCVGPWLVPPGRPSPLVRGLLWKCRYNLPLRCYSSRYSAVVGGIYCQLVPPFISVSEHWENKVWMQANKFMWDV